MIGFFKKRKERINAPVFRVGVTAVVSNSDDVKEMVDDWNWLGIKKIPHFCTGDTTTLKFEFFKGLSEEELDKTDKYVEYLKMWVARESGNMNFDNYDRWLRFKRIVNDLAGIIMMAKIGNKIDEDIRN
jgi:hypothetical protein